MSSPMPRCTPSQATWSSTGTTLPSLGHWRCPQPASCSADPACATPRASWVPSSLLVTKPRHAQSSSAHHQVNQRCLPPIPEFASHHHTTACTATANAAIQSLSNVNRMLPLSLSPCVMGGAKHRSTSNLQVLCGFGEEASI